MESAAWARQARERSWWMKPWDRKRASSRCATRCSRCRWTVSSVSTPASSKTTGRIGRLPAPVGQASGSLRAERAGCRGSPPSSGRSRRVGRAAGSSRLDGRRRPVVLDERFGAEELERAGERIPEGRRVEAAPGSGRARAGSGSARSAPSGPPGARAPPRAPPR